MMNKKVIAVALALALAGGSYAQDDTAKKKVKAYMVSDAHLDTQWNWDIQTTINEYVWNKMCIRDRPITFYLLPITCL